MRANVWTGASLALVVLVAVGCATGGSQLQNAVYDTHKRVASLDKNLSGSIEKLNQNTADLLARLDSSDQQVKALQGTVEENSVKLGELQKKLETLANNLYRSRGMSQSSSQGLPDTSRSEVTSDPGEPRRLPAPGARSQPEPRSELTAPPAPAPAGAAPERSATAPPPPEPVAAAPARPAPAAAPAAGGNPEAEYQKAQRSYANEDYPAALEQFDGFLQRYPTSEEAPSAQLWKAKSLQNMEKYDDAIGEFQKLRTNYPNSVRVPYAMLYEALCHSKSKHTERASELLQEVVKNYPMTPAADQAKQELRRLQGR